MTLLYLIITLLINYNINDYFDLYNYIDTLQLYVYYNSSTSHSVYKDIGTILTQIE